MTLSEARKRPLSQHKSDSIMGYSSTVHICDWPDRAHLLEADSGEHYHLQQGQGWTYGRENKKTVLNLPHPACKILSGENRF